LVAAASVLAGGAARRLLGSKPRRRVLVHSIPWKLSLRILEV